MDDPSLRLLKVQRQFEVERALRIKAENEARKLRLELTRARRVVVALMQREQSRAKEAAEG
jgi:hypothetical protein